MAGLTRADRHWVVVLTGICLVLGALLGVQAKTQVLRGETEVSRRSSALLDILTATRSESEQQRKEIGRLRAQVAAYEREAASGKGLARLVNQQLQDSKIALGLLPVKGPGVELVVGDSSMKVGDTLVGEDPLVVHDFDLLRIANELWAAGAEAVSVNGQRIVAGSAIMCAGRLIEVNRVTIPSPFTFLAIGDPEKLVSALSIRGGYLDYLRSLKFDVKLAAKPEVVVPAISTAPAYHYARPVPPPD
jgi:uncharacterized protein YlxW (UPF0749 family)